MSEQAVGQGVSVLGGAVSLGALFPPDWMDEHTEYEDGETFFTESDGDPALTRGSDRSGPSDDHVAATTTFDDWPEMLGAALEDYQNRHSTSLTN